MHTFLAIYPVIDTATDECASRILSTNHCPGTYLVGGIGSEIDGMKEKERGQCD